MIVVGLIVCGIVSTIIPKEIIYAIILAILCGWLSTKLLVYVDAKVAFSSKYFFPSIVGFIHSLGWSVKMTCFISSSLFFLVTGIGKFFGKALLVLIGLAVLLLVVTLFVWFIVQFSTGLAGNL